MRIKMTRTNNMLRSVLLVVAIAAVCTVVPTLAQQQPQPASACPTLAIPSNGGIRWRTATDVKPLLAIFTCELGYQLIGNETSACHRTGLWSHTPPTCDSIGLRVYANQHASGLSKIANVSLSEDAIIMGLAESAQRARKAIGFQLRISGANHTAFLLKEDASLTNLIPSDAHITYLFGEGGTLKRYQGFKAAKSARLRQVDFSNDAAVLKGLKAAVAGQRTAGNKNIIGFSIAKGFSFRASLLSWDSLPLIPSISKTRHSFILQDEVEDQVRALGCYHAVTSDDDETAIRTCVTLPSAINNRYVTYFLDSQIKDLGCWATPTNGGNILRTIQPIRSGPVTKSACASVALAQQHDYFALTGGLDNPQCYTGQSDASDLTDDLYWTGGRSDTCNSTCPNGRDNCGAIGAAQVYRLPLWSRVSHLGHASIYPLRIPTEMRIASQEVLDQPGSTFFSSVSQEDQDLLDKRAAASAANGVPVNGTITELPTPDPWAHPLQYHFAGSQVYAVTKYVIQAPTLTKNHEATPSAWTFEGSADGFTWTVLDRQRRIAFYTGQKRTFFLRNTVAYHFHRLVVTENGGLGVPGFGIQGLTLFADRNKVRFLKALYRFENPAAPGWDSSFKNNDLTTFGGVINGTADNLLSIFNVTNDLSQVKLGKGSLQISNTFGSLPSYLAVDSNFKLPDGIPTRDRSFGISFWFFVNSTRDGTARYAANLDSKPAEVGILAWGNLKGDSNSNQISLDTEFQQVKNSFGVNETGVSTPELASGNLQDAWHHYAVSFDQVTGKHRVWLDTQLVSQRIYTNPQFNVAPERFVIGLRQLQGVNADGSFQPSDEFNGLLDDIAIFHGPFNTKAVAEIATGAFDSYLPLSCQGMSDEYLIEAGITWGRAPTATKERYMRNKCYTKPTSCQVLSDQYGMTPSDSGKAGYYPRKSYQRMKCATWPSILSKKKTSATCPPDQLTIVQDIPTREIASFKCAQVGTKICRAFIWSRLGNADAGLRPGQLNMCGTYLSELRYAKDVSITTRVEKYLLHPDSKVKCDSHDLPTHVAVPTSIHARWLCDSTPGCVGYVWSGLKGEHSKGRAPTPGRTILCSGLRKSKGEIYSYPDSGYEVGEKLGNYVTMPERFAPCSAFGAIAVVYNVTSSLAARRECDRYDGADGSLKCESYAWDMRTSQVRLCSSVPQKQITFYDDVETGLATPTTCQQMSDSWGIEYGHSWGFAPFDIKALFHTQHCKTKPRSCQQLSNAYQLSSNITSEDAEKIPGSIRDLWLRSACRTYPEIKESHYFISSTYEDLQDQINASKEKIDRLSAKVTAAELNPALTPAEQTILATELARAKELLQKQLDDIHMKQQLELGPLLSRAADTTPTLDQTTVIHNIVDGIIKESLTP